MVKSAARKIPAGRIISPYLSGLIDLMANKKFLFICGCARSGTTAFTHLFTAHYNIVLGMERFAHLVLPGQFRLSPEHFSRQRFLQVQPGDTFYNDFAEFHQFDTQIADKYDGCIYIGDKRPDLYLVYDQLFEAFPNCQVFFIYRDLLDVASSYQARSDAAQHWPVDRNYQAAIQEWHQSLRLTLTAIAKGYAVRPVNYADVFDADSCLAVIFELLELDMTASVHKRITGLRRRAAQLSASRQSYLSRTQQDEVNAARDTRLFDAIEQLNILRPGAA